MDSNLRDLATRPVGRHRRTNRLTSFEPEAIVAPTAIFYDPDETVLPPQHPTWLGEHIPNSTLVITPTLGHRSSDEDPTPDLRRMYGWLATA
jgi:pimeloyl-ACP methyl ester carboxylesterase